MEYKRLINGVVFPLIGVFIVLLNVVQIYFILKRRKLKVSVYHLNLAVSDVLLGLILVCIKLLEIAYRNAPSASLGMAVSFFRIFLISLTLVQSLLSIALLTFDRVLVIRKPILYRLMTLRQKCLACLASWLLTFLYSIGMILGPSKGILKMFVQCLLTVAAIMIATICYVYIWRKTRRIILIRRFTAPTTDKNGRSEERNFLKLCIKTFVVFLICWLPYVCFGIVIYGTDIFNNLDVHRNVSASVHTLAFANSLLNPLIYLMHTSRMHRARSKIQTTRSSKTSSRRRSETVDIGMRQLVEVPSPYIERENGSPSSFIERENGLPSSYIKRENGSPSPYIGRKNEFSSLYIEPENGFPSPYIERENRFPSPYIRRENEFPSPYIERENRFPSPYIERENEFSSKP